MKTIQDAVNNKLVEMSDSGEIDKIIGDSVEAAVKRSIKSLFENYGELGKQIKEGMEKGLRFNTDNLDFLTYNQQMSVAVNNKLKNIFNQEVADKYMAEIDKVLEPAPKEVSIYEVIETIIGFWREDDDITNGYDTHATIELEESSSGNYFIVLISPNGDKHSGDSLHLFIHREDGIKISHNMAFNPTCLHPADSYIFRLFAGGTKITGLKEFDEDDIDTSISRYDY